jgi:hypothetical protein
MSRRFWATAVLIVLLLQTAAGLSAHGAALKFKEFGHALAHAQATDHHHHDDGALHLEPTSDEAAHQHDDEGVQLSALLPAPPAALPALRPRAVGWAAVTALSTVFLKGPLRPPRCAA